MQLVGVILLVGHRSRGADALAIPDNDLSDEMDVDDLQMEDDESDELDQHSLNKRSAVNISAVVRGSSRRSNKIDPTRTVAQSRMLTQELSKRLVAHRQKLIRNNQSVTVDGRGHDYSLEDVAEQFINETDMSVNEVVHVMDQLDMLSNLSLEDPALNKTRLPEDWFLVRHLFDKLISSIDVVRDYYWTPTKTRRARPIVSNHPSTPSSLPKVSKTKL